MVIIFIFPLDYLVVKRNICHHVILLTDCESSLLLLLVCLFLSLTEP